MKMAERQVEAVSRSDAVSIASRHSSESHKKPRVYRHTADHGDATKRIRNEAPGERRVKPLSDASRSFSRPRAPRRQTRLNDSKPQLPIVKTAAPPPLPQPLSIPAIAARRRARGQRSQHMRLQALITRLATTKVDQPEMRASESAERTRTTGNHLLRGRCHQPLPAQKKATKSSGRRLSASHVERTVNDSSFPADNPRASSSTSLKFPTKPVAMRHQSVTATPAKSMRKPPDGPKEESYPGDVEIETPPLPPGAKHLALITTAQRATRQLTHRPVSFAVPLRIALPLRNALRTADINTYYITATPHFAKRTPVESAPNNLRQSADPKGERTPQTSRERSARRAFRGTSPTLASATATATPTDSRAGERQSDADPQQWRISNSISARTAEDLPQCGVRRDQRNQGRPGVFASLERDSSEKRSICLNLSENARLPHSRNYLPRCTSKNVVCDHLANNSFTSLATKIPDIKPIISEKKCSTVSSVLQIAPPCTPDEQTGGRRKENICKITPSSEDKKETTISNEISTKRLSVKSSSGNSRRKVIVAKKSSSTKSRSSSNALAFKKSYEDENRTPNPVVTSTKRTSQDFVNSNWFTNRKKSSCTTTETSKGCTMKLPCSQPSASLTASIATSSTQPWLQSPLGTTTARPISSKLDLAALPSASNGSDVPAPSRPPAPRRTIAGTPHRSLGRERYLAVRRHLPPCGTPVMPSEVVVARDTVPAAPLSTTRDLTAHSLKTLESFAKPLSSGDNNTHRDSEDLRRKQLT